MATVKTISPISWVQASQNQSFHVNLWKRFLLYADSQKANRTLWFFIALMVHGVIILPLPIVLIYYFNAPALILVITMVCFFTNFIANMGGSGIRSTLISLAASVLIHIIMLIVFII
jgi:hypothetical protein